jgi:hypothetical protein
VHLQFTVPDLEARRLIAAQGAGDAALLAYLAAHLEVGQLACVSLVLTIVFLLARRSLGLTRRTVTEVVASCLVAVGMFWFVSRSDL